MPQKNFVHEYDSGGQQLRRVLAGAAYQKDELTPSELNSVARLEPVIYLHGYLSVFSKGTPSAAKTIVVERDYVDRDHLTEYAGYHSKSFQASAKRTTRIHFFGEPFSQLEFEALLLGSSNEALRNSYLGFVIVRPMKSNFIGRTCLKQYPERRLVAASEDGSAPSSAGKRYYPVSRNYPVNLFGMTLNVQSVAFQEQDRIVGACASSAIYSLLHGVKPVFDVKVYSALDITRLASGFSGSPSSTIASSMRALPNTGLTFGQMYQTLGAVGLNPTLIGFALGPEGHANQDALATLYAYLSAGLPVIAHVALLKESDFKKTCKEVFGKITHASKHAFTITGYGETEGASGLPVQKARIPETCLQVDKYYVHCDRIGPFAKFELTRKLNFLVLKPEALATEGGKKYPYGGIGNGEPTYAVPIVLIVPTDEKLRLGFSQAYEVAQALHGHEQFPGMQWDIKVQSNSAIKAEWRESRTMSATLKLELMRKSLPRFCWRVIAVKGRQPQFEVLLDATASDAPSSVLLAAGHVEHWDVLRDVASKGFTNLLSGSQDTNGIDLLLLERLQLAFEQAGGAAMAEPSAAVA